MIMLVIIEIPDELFNEMNDQCLHTTDGNVDAAEVILEAAKTKFPVAGETFELIQFTDRERLRDYDLLS